MLFEVASPWGSIIVKRIQNSRPDPFVVLSRPASDKAEQSMTLTPLIGYLSCQDFLKDSVEITELAYLRNKALSLT